MKNRRTDPLSPIPGRAIKIRGNAVTTQFDDGKVFMREKPHFKIVCERFCFERQERVREKTTSEDNTAATSEDNILDWRRTDQNTRNATFAWINRNEAKDKSTNPNSSYRVSNGDQREPIYVTRRGREIYPPVSILKLKEDGML